MSIFGEDIDKKVEEIIKKLNLEKTEIFSILKTAGVIVIALVVYKLWRKSRG